MKSNNGSQIKSTSPNPSMAKDPRPYDQVVYLLQGGGALGAYQMGVCEGLLQNNREPNWVIGTSIGAINGAIIAGNKPENRIEKLKQFWNIISSPLSDFLTPTTDEPIRKFQNFWIAQWTLLIGLPGFFKPRPISPWFISSSSADKLSFYETTELRKTLKKVIDFDLINQKKVRLTLGSVCVEDGASVNFDNFNEEIRVEHVLASCALPPGFPAIRINGKYYWDGGINSNTPLSVILEEEEPCKALCFMIDLYSHRENNPKTIFDIFERRKDLEYAGRHHEVLKYFCERHQLALAIHKLWEQNDENKKNPILQEAVKFKQPSSLNIIRFHYKHLPYDLWSEDFEFSAQSIQEHYQNGCNDFKNALEKPKWFDVIDDDLVILNEL